VKRKSARELIEMLDTTDEVEQIEAKDCRRGSPGKAVLKTISAFSNEPGLGGGFIVFGVARQSDRRYEVVGVQDPDRLQREFTSNCSSVFNERVRPVVWVDRVDGKNIVVAQVPEMDPPGKPVFIEATGLPKGAYRRIGSTDQRCTLDDIEELLALRRAEKFDMTVFSDVELDEIDPDALDEYRAAVVEYNPNAEVLNYDDLELLRALKCVKKVDGEWLPTAAGILLFGTPMALRRHLPSTYIDYIRVPGTEWVPSAEERYTHAVEVREPLVRAIDKVTQIVLDELPVPFALDPETLRRKDAPAIPATVLREAVANAVMHRTYLKYGGIQVIRYDNRLEINNLGRSLKPRDELHETGSAIRNPTIANVLRDMRLAENKGTGIQAMRREMRKANRTPPTFESNRHADKFTATFLFRHFLSDRDLEWLRSLDAVDPDEDAALALVYVREMGRIDNAKLRDLTGLDTLAASKCLTRLRDAGLLEMCGSGSATYYEAGPELAQSEVSELESRMDDGKSRMDDGKSRMDDGKSRMDTASDIAKRFDIPEALARRIAKLGGKAEPLVVQKLLVECCQVRPFSTGELVEVFGRTRDHLTRHYLKPLLGEGVLERTHPDNPRHPKQAYKAVESDEEE
jgi:ATP-dependent DNA helicase RecG